MNTAILNQGIINNEGFVNSTKLNRNWMNSVLCVVMVVLIGVFCAPTMKACVTQATLNADIANIVAATAADVAASIALAAALAAFPFGWLAVGEASAALVAAGAWEYAAWTTYNQDKVQPLCCTIP